MPDDIIDIGDILSRLTKGWRQVVGFSLVGLVIASMIAAAACFLQKSTTSARVSFTPASPTVKFQPDDLRAPAIVADAMQRLGLDGSGDTQSKIRSAISVEAIIPASVTKLQDRQRLAGQTPPPYTPDEYTITLALPRSFPLSRSQRERLVVELVNVAREHFRRTNGTTSVAFGAAFETARGADFPEYDIIFNAEFSSLAHYLAEQEKVAPSFRSPSTNLTFSDLQQQTNLIEEIELNEVLGVIFEGRITRTPDTTRLKIGYYLKRLELEEKRALEAERVVRNLLVQATRQTEGYVLGAKSSTPPTTADRAPALDQGLIDSLLANDSYNFLVKKALNAGLVVKQVQADKARLERIRNNLLPSARADTTPTTQKQATEALERSLEKLKGSYEQLVMNVRRVQSDFDEQSFGHAIRLSSQVRTPSILKALEIGALLGVLLGGSLAAGLSLLGIYVGRNDAHQN
jgi:hypothetical protein